MSEDREAQEDELLALASIYDEEEFHRAEAAQGGEIQLCLELPAAFKVVVKGEKQAEYDVSFLPPLVLNFELPVDYPTASSPVFTLSSKWLTRTQMSALCRRLDQLWEENQGCVVLFTWVQFLKEEALDFLAITSSLVVVRMGGKAAHVDRSRADAAATHRPEDLPDNEEELKKRTPAKTMIEAQSPSSVSPLPEASEQDPRAVLVADPRADLLPQLLDFDEAQRKKVFDGRVFGCGICFLEKLGVACLCFKECQHVYCRDCMSEYFQIQIHDGKVHCLNCPEPKCSSRATPLQVKQLVDKEQFARYDRLLLQSSLDLMADVVYCPRQSCGSAVILEPDATMGICPVCQYAFCTLCKLGYHGLSHCKVTSDELRGLRDDYLAASPEDQRFMEQRYGKRVIQRAVEESYSREWLTDNCKCCPRCGTNIQVSRLHRRPQRAHWGIRKGEARVALASPLRGGKGSLEVRLGGGPSHHRSDMLVNISRLRTASVIVLSACLLITQKHWFVMCERLSVRLSVSLSKGTLDRVLHEKNFSYMANLDFGESRGLTPRGSPKLSVEV